MSEIKLSAVPKRGVPGVVTVTAHNCPLDSQNGLRVVLERPGHNEPFLGQKGWQTVEASHGIDVVEQVQKGLVFELGPQIVQFMSTGGYRLRLFSASSSEASVGVLAWQRIPIYRPKKEAAGAFDRDRTIEKTAPNTPLTGPKTGTGDEKIVSPGVADSAGVVGEEAPENTQKRGNVRLIALSIAVLLVFIAATGAGWYILSGGDRTSEPKNINNQLSAFLATNPTPDKVYEKGQEYLSDGETGAAMSLFRRAGEQGVGRAYLALAEIYDPTVNVSHDGLNKDGGKAYSYYVKARHFEPERTAEAVNRLKAWASDLATTGDEKAQQLTQMMAIGN
ncbi:hypothetical protein [uncultured Thalassospira sp.]|uniref:hypothetical protein n=1 Tax=uncultured Thalassospira sp. TaxID=404382 RepID=UPI0030D99680|tara:strand:- start:14270 stop:15274 length:1005 start_codon:yes stop_codon:yes gene_type:complete